MAPGGTLPDGTYDAFVVDATERSGPGTPLAERVLELELTVIAGEHKGEVLAVTAVGLPGDEVDLMGMPATLTVADGRPSVRIDD